MNILKIKRARLIGLFYVLLVYFFVEPGVFGFAGGVGGVGLFGGAFGSLLAMKSRFDFKLASAGSNATALSAHTSAAALFFFTLNS